MATQHLPKSRVEPSEDVAESVKVCVQQLVDVSAHLQLLSASETNGEGTVLLDVEVDDVRCVLIRQPANSARIPVTLSPREHEIVRMVAQGYPNKTIAAVLDISSWTVGTHLRRIFAKLGVGSRAAMVARFLERASMDQTGATNKKMVPLILYVPFMLLSSLT